MSSFGADVVDVRERQLEIEIQSMNQLSSGSETTLLSSNDSTPALLPSMQTPIQVAQPNWLDRMTDPFALDEEPYLIRHGSLETLPKRR